jgi:hypothetical protein
VNNGRVSTAGVLLRLVLPLVLHAAAREVDAALGLALHTTLDLPDFVPLALGLVDPSSLVTRAGIWLGLGALLLGLLARARAARQGSSWREALAAETRGLPPLLLRPALTLLALACLAWRPTYPYGFTLPVALTQDLGPAQDLAALAAFVAGRWPPGSWPWRFRLPAPGPVSLWLLAFLAYGLMTPPWALHWDGHPGNEPKTLRMAVALGHGLSLDVEGVSARMEDLSPMPIDAALGRAVRTLVGESTALARAAFAEPGPFDRRSVRATRVNRQTIRGKDGGVFHVLAPGPSLALAPLLRLDRASNLRLGRQGRLAATVLAWNALAAALVGAVFLLVRDACGRPGLAAGTAAFFALVPPFVFYSFQFYPEMPGALLLALAFRTLALAPRLTPGALLRLGLVLAALPWLHQKFLPVWAVLVVLGVGRAVNELVPLGALVRLLLPQAVTLWLTLVYNFAVTGSARPDALFLAWGPGGVTGARLGQGLLGLLLDARYGLLPYAPVYLLAAGGLLLRDRSAARLRFVLPAAAAYYVTVASADNWSGAVCNLGRYLMPVAPLAVALAALVVARAGSRRGVLAVAGALGCWTAVMARALWLDPHAANDCALLLEKSAFANGWTYLPGLFIRTWAEGAPGLWARVLAWVAMAGVLGVWLARSRGGSSPRRALACLTLAVLAIGFVLERWPADRPEDPPLHTRTTPRLPGAFALEPGATAFLLDGAAAEGPDHVRSRGGEMRWLVRTREGGATSLPLVVEGEGTLRATGRPALALAGRPLALDLPLRPIATWTGRRGLSETLAVGSVAVETGAGVVLRPRRP